ncbi:MAG: hypothetical protein ABIR47_11710 [Candidatus Kapaibacterium sp.]
MSEIDRFDNCVSGNAARRVLFNDSLARLRGWLEANRYAGIEPHDAITSPILSRTPLGRSPFLRLAALQGLRRFPLNIRAFLGIRPDVNTVSLGWALRGYALIGDAESEGRIGECLEGIYGAIIGGYSGACWGYYFPWQTRADYKPPYLPNIVSTAFVGQGLLDIYQKRGDEKALRIARSACDFILRDLHRGGDAGSLCFSYTPTDDHQVYNASILGAHLLARVGAITGERELTDTARAAVAFVVDHQQEDGSWRYGVGDFYTFIDNFHTGYVLMSLRGYMESVGEREFDGALRRGEEFYRRSFFLNGAIPKYYHNRLFPIDAHAATQAIITLLDCGDGEGACRVAEWTIRNMQAGEGYFIYQIHRRYRNAIPYLRWANAWMLYALARLTSAEYLQNAEN